MTNEPLTCLKCGWRWWPIVERPAQCPFLPFKEVLGTPQASRPTDYGDTDPARCGRDAEELTMDSLDREIDDVYRDVVGNEENEDAEAGAELSDGHEPENDGKAEPVEPGASDERRPSTDEPDRRTSPPELDAEHAANAAESTPRPTTLLRFPSEVFPKPLQRFIDEVQRRCSARPTSSACRCSRSPVWRSGTARCSR